MLMLSTSVSRMFIMLKTVTKPTINQTCCLPPAASNLHLEYKRRACGDSQKQRPASASRCVGEESSQDSNPGQEHSPVKLHSQNTAP